jgi:molecular chaperone GrpE
MNPPPAPDDDDSIAGPGSVRPSSGQPPPEEPGAGSPDAAESDAAESESQDDPEKAALERRVAEVTDTWRRSVAELENYRKRMAREMSLVRAQERANVAARFLPVIDNLERAIAHADAGRSDILEGLRAVHQQAIDVLTGLGYPRREDAGKAFDPTYHEAVSTVADRELPPGTVAQVLQPGYGSDAEVLRPASVVVATGG